jgi:hypothetical protein
MVKQPYLLLVCTVLIFSTPITCMQPTTLQRVAQGASTLTTIASVGYLNYGAKTPKQSMISWAIICAGLIGMFTSDAFGIKTFFNSPLLPGEPITIPSVPLKSDEPVRMHTPATYTRTTHTSTTTSTTDKALDSQEWLDNYGTYAQSFNNFE